MFGAARKSRKIFKKFKKILTLSMEWKYDITLNKTQNDIMKYLTKELGSSSRFISYGKIGKEVGKSRHSVRYSIDILVSRNYLRIENRKLAIV